MFESKSPVIERGPLVTELAESERPTADELRAAADLHQARATTVRITDAARNAINQACQRERDAEARLMQVTHAREVKARRLRHELEKAAPAYLHDALRLLRLAARDVNGVNWAPPPKMLGQTLTDKFMKLVNDYHASVAAEAARYQARADLAVEIENEMETGDFTGVPALLQRAREVMAGSQRWPELQQVLSAEGGHEIH